MKKPILLTGLLLGMFAANTVFAQSTELRGAGSTFAAGAYQSWSARFIKEGGTMVQYKATGSGDGIKQIKAKNVDFGASDYALSAQELKKNDLVQIPTLIGGIVPVVNVPGIKAGQLRLSGGILAQIYLGNITSWNDPAIQALNPNVTLPALRIKCIVRQESSGTTAGFTEYLSKVDEQWGATIGSGPVLGWPKECAKAPGNDGVAAVVRETAGGLGYVSANVVAKNALVYALMQNHSKNFVAPTNEALVAAVKASTLIKQGDKLSFIDMPSAFAWPITDVTYILLDRKPKDIARATEVLRFFYWSFLHGDTMASETGYIPLPDTIQARAVASLHQIHDAKEAPLDFMTSQWKGKNAKSAAERSEASARVVAKL